MMTNLLFKWTDVPPVESENIQEAPGVKYVFLPWLITGQSCRHIKQAPCLKTNKWTVGVQYALMIHPTDCRYIPLRSCNSVMDSWLSLHDWMKGEAENFSSHLMNDGHAAKPWSKEFRKQVLPRFSRPGTIPDRKYESLSNTALKLVPNIPSVEWKSSYQFLPLFLFFLSVIGPHKTYTPAAIAAAIPPMTPQFLIILFL